MGVRMNPNHRVIECVEDIYAAGSDVLRGISSRPTSKFLRRLAILHRWWIDSAVRILASELYRVPLRIQASLQRPNPKYAVRLPSLPDGLSASWEQACTFARDCSDYTQRQHGVQPWLGELDREILGLAFQAGAEWALCNLSKSVCNAEEVPPG